MKAIFTYFLFQLACLSCSIQAVEAPDYLKYRSDFVQQQYSTALLGFAFEHKCMFLDNSLRQEYEQNLNTATELFIGYLLAKKMIQEASGAPIYIRDMVLGTMKYSKGSNCDAIATKRINTGFDTADKFRSLIEVKLQEEMEK